MAKIENTMDYCPMPLQSNSLNVKHHMEAIEEHGLGPADPRQDNTEFWTEKAKMWNCTEGDARGRLCSNCKYYYNTSFIKDCIDYFPAKDLKASALPITPKWADIESKPQAYCVLLDITCSPVRTCDNQLMGGPIDDDKVQLEKYLEPIVMEMLDEEND